VSGRMKKIKIYKIGFYIIFSIMCVSSIWLGVTSYIDNEDTSDLKTYDFRYYGEGYHYFEDLNISARFFSHDKAQDYLELLFFKDGNYSITVFFDIDNDFTTTYVIEKQINVSGIGSVYPYIDRAYKLRINNTDLFNADVFIESDEYISGFTEFETRLIGVETLKSK
jgi:hypothetical protein